MRRIGIMGGTFNPVHMAHLLLAEHALEQFALDKIMFLPSRQPAYKAKADLLPDNIRLELLKLAIAEHPDFYVSDLELKRDGNTYTADTMLELKQLQPDTEFYFIVGGDSLFKFEHWHRPDIILENAHLLATTRGTDNRTAQAELIRQKAEELNQKFGADIQVFHTPLMEISSTDIRNRLKEGRSIRYLVPEAVRKYLTEHLCFEKKPQEIR